MGRDTTPVGGVPPLVLLYVTFLESFDIQRSIYIYVLFSWPRMFATREIYIHTHTHTHTYVYIHTYMCATNVLYYMDV